MTPNYMLYLVFGEKDRKGILKELICSLLSFQKVSSEETKKSTQIVIYSSNTFPLPDSLNNLNIIFKSLSEQEISESIRRNNGFTLALKVDALHNFFKTITKGNVLLIDSDTFFTKDPLSLFKLIERGNFIMHLKEPKIYQRPALRRYLNKKNLKDIQGNQFKIKPKTDIWNSGVVGLNDSHSQNLDSALSLIEQLTQDSDSHILEQVALSYVLQNNGKISSAHRYIVHYYFYKPFVHVLGSYFNFSFDEDREIIRELTTQNVIQKNIVYADLSKLLIKNLKGSFIEWYFVCLPYSTQVGKHLVHEFLYDKRYFKSVIKTYVKIAFKTYKLWEYNLSDKLRDRYGLEN